MKKTPIKTTNPMVNLSNYTKNILSPEDHPLFDDAVKAGKVGALRAAYVMIWLACAESLKRRFREAQKRDDLAGRYVGEIETKEREHKSVDKFVLTKALDYGFISDSGHAILNHIYEMRCLYGHPYEEAPSQEQVSHAAAVVVEHVLSKPVKLRHGFGEQLLKSLLEEPSFLDDQDVAVEGFAKDILSRLDENVYKWLLDRYWGELEKFADDSSVAVFFRRGVWFCQTMLLEAGVAILSSADWHDRFSRFPKVLIRICSNAEIFEAIGKRAQDSFVGLVFSESGARSSVLSYLAKLYEADVLSDRQRKRFLDHISEMPLRSMRAAELSTKTCYDELISSMESHNWYAQSPAIKLIVSNGPDQAAELSEEQQVNIGRNILQCAEGTEKAACEFLEELSEGGSSWPFDVVRGIALESFTNEKNQIRFKDRHLGRVISTLGHLKPAQRNQIISEIATSVDAGTPKDWTGRHDFKSAIDMLKGRTWMKPLVASLLTQEASLQTEEEGA